ncbi:hypothetical protein SAMN04515618_107106 [Collimonas sp. OK307]|nr:hypothetical protein SAMN04515618_107106 [Collimonas sp. OK307]
MAKMSFALSETSKASAWAKKDGILSKGKRPVITTLFCKFLFTICSRTQPAIRPSPTIIHRMSLRSRRYSAAFNIVGKSCASPIFPENNILNISFFASTSGALTTDSLLNKSSDQLGKYFIFSLSLQYFPILDMKDLDWANTKSQFLYINLTKTPTASSIFLDFTTPTALSDSGHRSNTQSAIGVFFMNFRKIAGIATVMGDSPHTKIRSYFFPANFNEPSSDAENMKLK